LNKLLLYLVATPLGNLGDISKRAIDTLAMVDFIVAEDTRKSIKLLNHFNIKKPLISYYEHNKRERGEEIVKKLLDGQTCALITDAGMPAISDPGQDLVALCIEKDIPYTVIPGPCAAVCALAVSGLPTGRFCFEGFLSISKKSRNEHLNAIKNEQRTLIFYEAPHKIKNTLKDLLSVLGDRKITIVRELTKIYEEILPITLKQAIEIYNEKEPKGEFVLVIEGAKEVLEQKPTEQNIKELFEKLTKEGAPKSQAIKEIASNLGLRKNEVYSLIINKE